MKKYFMSAFGAVLFSTLAVFSSCASMGGSAVFEDISGKEWLLSEVRSAGNTVRIDRAKLAASNMARIFTINLTAGQVSGTAAPNHFTGAYTAGSDNALSFGTLATTRIALLNDPEGLNEREYFVFLSRVSRWNLRGGKLELYSADPNGNEAVLVYSL